jgi:ribosomal protein S18 acetylase RimI-like enzyme
MEVRSIRPDEKRGAAALVYQCTRGKEPDVAQLTDFLEGAVKLGTDLDRQVVAVTEDGGIVGCAMYFPMPDRTASATPAFCAPGFATLEVKVALLRALREKAARDGLFILQAFLDELDDENVRLLTQSGFESLARMLFMERRVSERDRNIPLDKHIRWLPHSAARHDDFVSVVTKTYEGTLDCSKIAEVRDVNLTLESYRARDGFDPSLWLLAEIEQEYAGCLLLSCRSDRRSCEVAYLGVVPAHRGKGLGRKMMEKGLFEVSLRAPGCLLTLAVDEANSPAVELYRALGFVTVERKQVYFSLLATR